MIKPKYSTGDILLDNDGKTYFQVLKIIEYSSFLEPSSYVYELQNLTLKYKNPSAIRESTIVQNTTKIESYAAKILLGTIIEEG